MANQVKTPKVTVIDPIAQEKAKLRVAAYARVSSDSADQLNSYLAQVDYYTRHIGDNPDWELADIYADEGISGLDTQKRDEFNRMMADCRAGKIDRILVKSMSRFARNTRDTLHFMRELMRLGVTIRFEKESIDTGRLSSEQTATIYAAFAQMESTGHSSNMRLSVKMRMEKGIFTPSSMPYGYRLNGLEPEIVPEEAEVVRHIFSSALRGRGQMDIAQELNESGVVRRHGRGRWHHHTISYILTNPAYTGNTIWNKSFRSDTIPFPMVINHGQKPKYTAEDSHPAIISSEDFQRVQTLIAARKEQFTGGAQRTDSVYFKRVYCGKCGTVCRRKVNSGKPYWVCNRHNVDKDLCSISPISEATLTAAALRFHNKLVLHGPELLQPLLDQLREIRERELRSNQKLSDIDKEIANISGQNLVLIRLKSKGCIDPALALSQADEMNRRLRDLRRLRRKVLEAADGDEQIQSTEAILDYLETAQWQTEVTPELFENLVEQITVASADEVKFRLLNGLELTERLV
jgi:site-specific DNA recombinase